MLSSVEEAKEGENLVDLYVDRRIVLNIYWASRSSGREVLWLRRVLWLLRTL